MVCVGKVTAMTTSPDGRYCVAAIAEKLHVWQVCECVCVSMSVYMWSVCLCSCTLMLLLQYFDAVGWVF